MAAQARRRRQAPIVARHPASRTPASRRPPSPRVRRRRATVMTTMSALAVVVFLFAFVYPTSTFLGQRSDLNRTEERLARLEAETRRLEEENEKLNSDAEIERIAREQYGLVREGETPYAIVPGPTTTTVPAGDGNQQP